MFPKEKPLCDIIIPTWNLVEYLKPCIESIYNYTSYPFKLIIVDNGSTDLETLKYLDHLEAQEKKLEIIRNKKNEGFSRGVNIGIRHSKNPLICLLNNDTLVTPGWLDTMVDTLQIQENIGVVFPHSTLFDSYPLQQKGMTLEESVLRHSKILEKDQQGSIQEISLSPFFCVVLKREIFNKIGLLDEIYYPGCYEDWDFQLRLSQKGYVSVLNKKVYVYHYIHTTINQMPDRVESKERNKKKFYERRGNEVDHLRIFCPLLRVESLSQNIQAIYKLLRRDNKVWLLVPSSIYVRDVLKKENLILHMELRIIVVPFLLFYLACVFFYLVKKKSFHIIYVPEAKVRHFFKKLPIFMKMPIVSSFEEFLSSRGSLILS